MAQYNPKSWFAIIFKFHKSDTFSILFWAMISIALYTAGMVYLQKNILAIPNSAAVHSLLGFVISLLLVFRTNTAYDRWWEGRKLWGNLVNASRNFAMQLDSILPKDAAPMREHYFTLINNFVVSLKEHLQDQVNRKGYEESSKFKRSQLDGIEHIPNKFAGLLYDELMQLNKDGLANDAHLLILTNELKEFTNITGACERIKNTPIPNSYSIFLKKFLFVYIMTLPFGFAEQLGYILIPIVVFVFYILISLEIIAENIENPFGADNDDLPTHQISKTIRKNTGEILNVGCGC